EIDFRIVPTAKKISLVNLIVPLRIGGSLASPEIYPDPASVAKSAVGVAAGIATGGILIGVISKVLFGSLGSEDADSCLKAIAIRANPMPAPSQKKAPPKTSETPLGDVNKVIDGIGGGLKSLFGP
ncbi:MAG: hypothetical protein O3A51_13430, partial [Verrucomicrobia bacterium]|nr:hypothetical protein [Verrucomicrobiota bacterium]